MKKMIKVFNSLLILVLVFSISLLDLKANCLETSKEISEIFVSNDSANMFILFNDSTFVCETLIPHCEESDVFQGKYTLNKDTITFVNDNICWSSASSINIRKAEIYKIKYIRNESTKLLLNEITQYTNNKWIKLFSRKKNQIITDIDCKEEILSLNKISIGKLKSNSYLESRYGHFVNESNEYGLKNTCWQSNQENMLIKIDNFNNIYLIDLTTNKIIKEGVLEILYKSEEERSKENKDYTYLYIVYDKLNSKVITTEKQNKIKLTTWQLRLINQELEVYEITDIDTFLGSEAELNDYKENPQQGKYIAQSKQTNIKFTLRK